MLATTSASVTGLVLQLPDDASGASADVGSAELPLGRLLVSDIVCWQPSALTSVADNALAFPLEADNGLS
jgi:hypothetical protein